MNTPQVNLHFESINEVDPKYLRRMEAFDLMRRATHAYEAARLLTNNYSIQIGQPKEEIALLNKLSIVLAPKLEKQADVLMDEAIQRYNLYKNAK